MTRSFEVTTPDVPDVRALIETHLAWSQATTPPEHVYAMSPDSLDRPDIVLYALREEGRLLAIGALRELSSDHLELKSMHTIQQRRRSGAGRAMVEFLIDEATRRGATRISLETGSGDPFLPARRLYESVGFVPSGAFGDYEEHEIRSLMTMRLPRD